MTTQFEVLDLPINQLSVSPINVRQDIGDVSELADSIREQGVLEPLVARRVSSESYEVIIGARRLAAAGQVGLSSVPVMVQDISDVDATIRSLVENIQRGDLSLEERVEAYRRLADMDPQRFGDARGLARATGRRSTSIARDNEAYETIRVLRPRGIEVRRSVPPADSERRAGRAIPESHAILIEQAITSVRSTLPEERAERLYEELARAVAPLGQDRARRLLDYFKMYPDLPVAEISARALATVQRDVTVSAETARRLEEIATERGQRDWGEAIAELVETATVPEPEVTLATESAEVTTDPEVLEPRQLEVVEAVPFPSLGQDDQSSDEGAHRQYQPIELAEQPIAEQAHSRILWNLERLEPRGFYTVGYASRSIEQFLELLQAVRVKTVIDARYAPISPYRPAFSKKNLADALSEHGIAYVHRGDLGVPRNVRQESAVQNSRDGIWSWYRTNVLDRWQEGRMRDVVDGYEGPVAFLCVEANPNACHRHLLFRALEQEGLKGFDL